MLNARHADAVAVGVLATVAGVAAATFGDYGLGWDDLTHAQYGQLLLDFYASGFRDQRAFSFVNLYRYGGGFDMAAALLAKVLPFGLFETRRLLGAAVGLIGLAATWRLGRRMGGPVAGLLALVLLAACPLYYGHMFMNPKDAPFAAMTAVALLAAVRAFEDYPHPAPATVMLLGLGFGLSVGTRIMGGFAIVGVLAALALLVAAEARGQGLRHALGRLGHFLRAGLPAVVIAAAAMALVWPWAVMDVRNLPRALLYFSQFFEKPWHELFGGELILVTDMPRRYVPVLLGLKLPELMQALAVAGLGWAFVMVFRSGLPAHRRAALLCIALAGSLPVAVAVATRPAMYNGIRHFLFILPPLAVLAGLAACRLLERARQVGHAPVLAGVAILAAGLALPIIEMVRLHPYQYVYFNHAAGGVRGADGRYMLDYWGLAFRQASLELLRRLAEEGFAPEGGRKWRIAVCGPHPPAAIVLGERFELTWDPKGADFAMMLGAFYCRSFDAPVLVEVRREGVVFARVYDIRGREFDSLFTIPPVRSDPQ
jgi:hypothetical protein